MASRTRSTGKRDVAGGSLPGQLAQRPPVQARPDSRWPLVACSKQQRQRLAYRPPRPIPTCSAPEARPNSSPGVARNLHPDPPAPLVGLGPDTERPGPPVPPGPLAMARAVVVCLNSMDVGSWTRVHATANRRYIWRGAEARSRATARSTSYALRVSLPSLSLSLSLLFDLLRASEFIHSRVGASVSLWSSDDHIDRAWR
jgi:hypothetical protein